MEEKDLEKRRCFVERVIKKILGKVARIRGIEEKKGEAERWVLITELEEVADKEEIVEQEER